MNIPAIFDVLRKGSSVADPAAWKTRSAAIVAVSGLIVAVGHALKGTPYDPHIDQTTADSIAGTVAFFVSLFSTYATSDKVGILPAKPDQSGSGPAETGQNDLSGGA